MPMQTIRLRRVFAFWIDILIGYVPIFLYLLILQIPLPNAISISLGTVIGTSFFVCFFLRDYLFHGRSLGKRICKLAVVDAHTYGEPSAKQLVLKNLCFFLLLFDGLFLLFSGKSLGERVTGTLVVYTPSASGKQVTLSKKRVKVAATAILVIAISMCLLVGISLSAVKKQPHYPLAYTYLVESDTFAQLQIEESVINLTGYASGMIVNENCENTSAVDAFTFFIQGRQYKVVCHQNGDIWYICEECTGFR